VPVGDTVAAEKHIDNKTKYLCGVFEQQM